MLAGLPATTLASLQRVVHAAVRLVANLDFRDPVAQSMQALHWLPVIYRIKYKLCLMMFEAINDRSPDFCSVI